MMRQEEQLLEAFWSNEEQARKPLPRRDVTTSRRHQVTTWRSTITEVNPSPRRDVTTSRRQLKILHLIIKCEGARDSRVWKNVQPETRIWRTCNTDLKNILGFLYWILFICLIIFGSYDDVLHILYFVSLFHDVLNSFLGLHQTLSQTMD